MSANERQDGCTCKMRQSTSAYGMHGGVLIESDGCPLHDQQRIPSPDESVQPDSRVEETEALKALSGLGERENTLLRKYGFVFDKWPTGISRGPIVLDGHEKTDLEGLTPEERWQALAFTLHTNLWEAATIARQSLERDDEPAPPDSPQTAQPQPVEHAGGDQSELVRELVEALGAVIEVYDVSQGDAPAKVTIERYRKLVAKANQYLKEGL